MYQFIIKTVLNYFSFITVTARCSNNESIQISIQRAAGPSPCRTHHRTGKMCYCYVCTYSNAHYCYPLSVEAAHPNAHYCYPLSVEAAHPSAHYCYHICGSCSSQCSLLLPSLCRSCSSQCSLLLPSLWKLLMLILITLSTL